MLNKDLILNWLKIPFQIRYTDPIVNTLELKKIANKIVMLEDSYIGYFVNNESIVGYDTKNQFVNQSLYLYLYNIDDVKKRAMLTWIYWNLHGGKGLTNGLSWSGPEKMLNFDNTNVNLETLASLNLLMLVQDYRNVLAEKYEELIANYIDNNFCFKKIKSYEELNKSADVPQQDEINTYAGLGSSPDATVALLATLSVGAKLLGISSHKELYNKVYNRWGGSLKTRICTNSASSIMSLFILSQLQKDNPVYLKRLAKHLGSESENEVANYFYTKLIGQI